MPRISLSASQNADFYAISVQTIQTPFRRLVESVRLVDGAWFRNNALKTALPFHQVWGASRKVSRARMIRSLCAEQPARSFATARQDQFGVWQFGEPVLASAGSGIGAERFLKTRQDAALEDNLGELPQF